MLLDLVGSTEINRMSYFEKNLAKSFYLLEIHKNVVKINFFGSKANRKAITPKR